jgi:predicted DNA-binding transcriptional regulator AlpA
MSHHRIIRLPEVLNRTGLARTTWYRLQAVDPMAPKSIKLTSRTIGFLETEIDAFIERLATQRS